MNFVFRERKDGATGRFADCILATTPPDVMNHNMETVPRLYKQACRPSRD